MSNVLTTLNLLQTTKLKTLLSLKITQNQQQKSITNSVSINSIMIKYTYI